MSSVLSVHFSFSSSSSRVAMLAYRSRSYSRNIQIVEIKELKEVC